MSDISISKHALVLPEGMTIGYRYKVSIWGKCNPTFVRDIGKDSPLNTNFVELMENLGARVTTANYIKGRIVDGCFRVSYSDSVSELETKEDLREFVKYISTSYTLHKGLKNQIHRYIIILKKALRDEGVEGYSDLNYNEDEFSCSARFLGGQGAWSGGDGDICDADVLDKSTYNKVNNAVKYVNSVIGNYNHRVDFTTGEKAWIDFNFSIK